MRSPDFLHIEVLEEGEFLLDALLIIAQVRNVLLQLRILLAEKRVFYLHTRYVLLVLCSNIGLFPLRSVWICATGADHVLGRHGAFIENHGTRVQTALEMRLHEAPDALLLQGSLSVEDVLYAHVILRVSLLVYYFVVQVLKRFDLMLSLGIDGVSQVVQL